LPGLGIALSWILIVSAGNATANPMLDDETGELLADLVRTSLAYDLFNRRCRGSRALTKTEDANRLFLSKYSLTVNQVITLYVGDDARAERANIEQAFLRRISQMGGCKQAKEQGLEGELDRDYRRLYERISDLP
jgi:hypothetical protein